MLPILIGDLAILLLVLRNYGFVGVVLVGDLLQLSPQIVCPVVSSQCLGLVQHRPKRLDFFSLGLVFLLQLQVFRLVLLHLHPRDIQFASQLDYVVVDVRVGVRILNVLRVKIQRLVLQNRLELLLPIAEVLILRT